MAVPKEVLIRKRLECGEGFGTDDIEYLLQALEQAQRALAAEPITNPVDISNRLVVGRPVV